MEINIDFPGGARVDAHFGEYTVITDQPASGGGASQAPSPFALFLASLATCAGYYVLDYCRKHNLPYEGIRLTQSTRTDPATGMTNRVDIAIQVPPGFPEKYLPAIVRAAELCKVKKHIENPPQFTVSARAVSAEEA